MNTRKLFARTNGFFYFVNRQTQNATGKVCSFTADEMQPASRAKQVTMGFFNKLFGKKEKESLDQGL